MSTFKTTNLNLHKWDGKDYVTRLEFNDNFQILDDKVTTKTEASDLETRLKAVNSEIETLYWMGGI